jgi:glycine cleavage system P protein (glycine dehydrogenase) subunit 2
VINKVTPHLSQNEALLFERSSPGKKGYQLPDLDVPPVDAAEALGAGNVRREIEGFPEVSEVEAIRHFTRLSTWNYAIDYGMYPLGSCTMTPGLTSWLPAPKASRGRTPTSPKHWRRAAWK